MGFEVNANTLALWSSAGMARLTTAASITESGLMDRGPSGRHLIATDLTGSVVNLVASAAATLFAAIEVPTFSIAPNRWLRRVAPDASFNSALLGEWTISLFMKMRFNAGATLRKVLVVAGPIGDTVEAENYLVSLEFNPTDKSLQVFWEQGLGVNVVALTPAAQWVDDEWELWTIRKKAEGGGTYKVSIFKRGVLIYELGGLANASGGGSSAIGLGNDPLVGGTTNIAYASYEEVHIQSRALSDAEVVEDAKYGVHSLRILRSYWLDQTNVILTFNNAVTGVSSANFIPSSGTVTAASANYNNDPCLVKLTLTGTDNDNILTITPTASLVTAWRGLSTTDVAYLPPNEDDAVVVVDTAPRSADKREYDGAFSSYYPLTLTPPEELLAVAAVPAGNELRILFGNDLNVSIPETVDPSRYAVLTSAGLLAVTSVEVEPRSVVLTLASSPPSGACSVTISAGTAQSDEGGLLSLTTLPFAGPEALLAIAADIDGTDLRIYFGEDIDQVYAPTEYTFSYSVTTPAGALAVNSVIRESRSVVLQLAAAPPPGDCSVLVSAGVARSVDGGSVAATMLDFQGQDVAGASEFRAIVAVFTAPQLRIYFGDDIDETYAPTTNPANYTITTPLGPMTASAVAFEDLAVVLTLPPGVPPEWCSVTVAAGAVRSVDESPAAEATLDFQGADTIAPTVSNFEPALGQKLRPDTVVSFDVRDNRVLANTLLVVRFATTGMTELVHDGTAFRNAYQGSRTAIEGGFRYSVSRRVGWPAGPTFQVYATDNSGNHT